MTKGFREKFNKIFFLDKVPIISVLTTFALVSFAWIFFRANDVQSAFYIAKNIFTGIPDLIYKLQNHQSVYKYIGLNTNEIILSIGLILFLETVHYIQTKINISEIFVRKPVYFRWAVYYSLILAILFLGVYENRQFIYFQF